MGFSRGITAIAGRNLLNEDDVPMAFLSVAATLEAVLWMKLFFEAQVPAEMMRKWSLGRFIDESIKKGLVPSQLHTFLTKFRSVRNLLVHDDNLLSRVIATPDLKFKLKNLLEAVIAFINGQRIRYVTSASIERAYALEVEREIQELYKIFKDL